MGYARSIDILAHRRCYTQLIALRFGQEFGQNLFLQRQLEVGGVRKWRSAPFPHPPFLSCVSYRRKFEYVRSFVSTPDYTFAQRVVYNEYAINKRNGSSAESRQGLATERL